jgi:hypothetical protein
MTDNTFNGFIYYLPAFFQTPKEFRQNVGNIYYYLFYVFFSSPSLSISKRKFASPYLVPLKKENYPFFVVGLSRPIGPYIQCIRRIKCSRTPQKRLTLRLGLVEGLCSVVRGNT